MQVVNVGHNTTSDLYPSIIEYAQIVFYYIYILSLFYAAKHSTVELRAVASLIDVVYFYCLEKCHFDAKFKVESNDGCTLVMQCHVIFYCLRQDKEFTAGLTLNRGGRNQLLRKKHYLLNYCLCHAGPALILSALALETSESDVHRRQILYISKVRPSGM